MKLGRKYGGRWPLTVGVAAGGNTEAVELRHAGPDGKEGARTERCKLRTAGP